MKITVLDRVSFGMDLDFDCLKKYGEITVYDKTTADDVLEKVENADILLLNKVKLTDAVFERAKNLKLVCEFATGFDNIDIASAKAHGVAVCNVPAYSTDSVALFTVATALSLAAHLREYNTFVADGSYSESGFPNKLTPLYHELAGKTWGILGLGNIGKKVAAVASAFGMKVICTKRTPTDLYPTVDIDTLCKESDILSVHCPLNDGTRGIINKARLAEMKPDAILVNEARGAVVNEADVAQAIMDGTLGGYGADVFAEEPFSKNHPFYAIKDRSNVLLTPHAAWGSVEARNRCLSIVCQNIESFLAGDTLNRRDI